MHQTNIFLALNTLKLTIPCNVSDPDPDWNWAPSTHTHSLLTIAVSVTIDAKTTVHCYPGSSMVNTICGWVGGGGGGVMGGGWGSWSYFMVNISQALWIKSVKFRTVILLASQKSLNCEPFCFILSSGHSGFAQLKWEKCRE